MKNILVLDDEKSVRTLCETELRQEGYSVVSTESCREVERLIESSKPSVVVFDLRLEDCDTFELLQNTRKHHPELPIILFTAYDSYRNDVRCTAADYYVVKSFDLTELKETIASAVSKHDHYRIP